MTPERQRQLDKLEVINTRLAKLGSEIQISFVDDWVTAVDAITELLEAFYDGQSRRNKQLEDLAITAFNAGNSRR